MSTKGRWSAPTDSSAKLEVGLLPADFQLCTMFGLIDMGTVQTNFGPKRQIKMLFEFPLHKAVFYEGDELRPHSVICTESFSMAPGANLRTRFVHGMYGKKIADSEADEFDVSQFLGKHFVATITHSADGKYANIDSIKPLTEANSKMFGLTSMNIERFNDIMDFNLNDGFEAESFKNLNKWFRDQIATKSEEGIAHRAKGGKFAEPPKDSNGNTGSSNGSSKSGGMPPMPSGDKKLVMINTSYTHEQFKASGWTDEKLVDAGHAKWQIMVPQEAPAPQGPPMPNALPSGPPVAPAAEALPPPLPVDELKPQLKMLDPDLAYDGMIAAGWNDELLIKHGHAILVNSTDGLPYEDDDLAF
jgi:hypothetical protein